MRHHFHRCPNLRTISLPAGARSGARMDRGSAILEELCEAKRLARCVGLVECDVLAPSQKRDLLAERATRLRWEEGGPSELAGIGGVRGAELRRLRALLLEERAALTRHNARIVAELAGADLREIHARPDEERELREAGLSIQGGPAEWQLHVERLDEIDDALEEMADPDYGICALCNHEIELARLQDAPQTRICSRCAHAAAEPQMERAL